jgi:hypothetical protein
MRPTLSAFISSPLSLTSPFRTFVVASLIIISLRVSLFQVHSSSFWIAATSTSDHCYDRDRRRASALLLSPDRTATSTNDYYYDRDRRRASALLLSPERTSTSTSYHRKYRHRRRATGSC